MMNIRRKAKLFIVVTIYIFLIIDCGQNKLPEQLEADLPKIVLENFCLTETKEGVKLWILEADFARVFDEIIKVDSVKIRFFNKEEQEFSVLFAPTGMLNTRTHNILVGDRVAVFTSDSAKLFTDSLFWLNDSQQIITDCPVEIIKQDSTVIKGNGLRADPYLEKIEILGTAQGISPIKLPDINQ